MYDSFPLASIPLNCTVLHSYDMLQHDARYRLLQRVEGATTNTLKTSNAAVIRETCNDVDLDAAQTVQRRRIMQSSGTTQANLAAVCDTSFNNEK